MTGIKVLAVLAWLTGGPLALTQFLPPVAANLHGTIEQSGLLGKMDSGQLLAVGFLLTLTALIIVHLEKESSSKKHHAERDQHLHDMSVLIERCTTAIEKSNAKTDAVTEAVRESTRIMQGVREQMVLCANVRSR